MLKRVFVASAVVGISGIALVAIEPAGGQQAPTPVVATVEGLAEGLFVDVEVDAGLPPNGEGDLLASSPNETPDPAGTEILNFGPAPRVAVGPEAGGPFTDSLVDISIPPDVSSFAIEVAEVGTAGATGPAGAVASDTRLFKAFLAGVNAEELTSECAADITQASGTTTISNGAIVNTELPENPAPNTVLTPADVPGLNPNVTITLNEQSVVSGPGGPHIEVTAVHVVAEPLPGAELIGEFYAGRVVCGVTPVFPPAPIVREPTFTG